MDAYVMPDDPVKRRIHVYGAGRRCHRCGAMMSKYNPYGMCFCHRERKLDDNYGTIFQLKKELTKPVPYAIL